MDSTCHPSPVPPMRVFLHHLVRMLLALTLAASTLLPGVAQARAYFAISPFAGAPQSAQGLRLVLRPQTPPRAVVGVPYTLDLRQWLMVVGPDAIDRTQISWTIPWGALPAGLSLSSQGVISGVPLVVSPQGGFPMATITARYENASDTRGVVIPVMPLEQALLLAPGPLPQGTVGDAYQFDLASLLDVPAGLASTGAAGPFWSVMAGSFPPGIGLTPAGTLYGTPTEPSTGYSFTARVLYGEASATRTYSLVVSPLQASLALTGFSARMLRMSAGVEIDLKQYLSVSGPQAGEVDLATSRWALAYGELPPGIGLDPSGVLRGAPGAPGAYTFGVQVSASGLSAQGDFSVTVEVGAPRQFKAISVGWGHACGIASVGAVFCWGDNSHGQLGDGTTQSRASSVAVVGLPEPAVAVSAGHFHTCAVTTSGKAFCWGYGAYGQLGYGGYAPNSRPVAVSGRVGVTNVSAGWLHTCALSGNSVYCWGDNSKGALGRDNGQPALSPVPVRIGPEWLQGAAVDAGAGYGFTCALATSGKLNCWGAGASGQLGDGRFAASTLPVVVALEGKSTGVSVGFSHTCASLVDSSLACWGDNSMGQLGNGNIGGSVGKPVRLPGATAYSQVMAGYQHSCGIRQGAVYCWGSNSAGELGTGSFGSAKAQPTGPIGGLASVVQVGVGYRYSCALESSGTAKCWGMGDAGELGNGLGLSSAVPVTVF